MSSPSRNIVDSSGWLEYFADGPNAKVFASAIEDTDHLLVPSLSLAEVFKRMLQQRGESDAMQAVATMMQSHVIDLDASLALQCAYIGAREKLALADSIMLATARANAATLWTQDADFAQIQGVRYVKARSPRET